MHRLLTFCRFDSIFHHRNHPLAKHSDVLTCIETRISMLSMTYTKYIEVNLCCFIPGKVNNFHIHHVTFLMFGWKKKKKFSLSRISWFKVIDEVLHVLCTIAHTRYTRPNCVSEIFILADRPLRTHEVLQELRDISSMAIEHFEEKVAPTLKKAYCELPTRSLLNCSTVQFQCKLKKKKFLV